MLLKLAISVLLASNCLAQTATRQYLNLTTAQATAIVSLNQKYAEYLGSQQQQASSINNQLSSLLTKAIPDPEALGSLAVQLELIRRDKIAKQATLQQLVAAQLTQAQAGPLQTLTTAAILQPLVNDAQCAYLVKVLSVSKGTTAQVSGDFTIYDPLAFVPAALPYVPPTPTGSFCGSQIFPISVREYLNLSDAQVAALYSASAAYNDFYARQQDRLSDLNQQIATLKAAANADPLVLGQQYAEIARIGQAIIVRGNQLRDTARTQLTAAQAAQVNTLQQAQDLNINNVIYTAINCGLLVPSAGSSYYGLGPNGYCSL